MIPPIRLLALAFLCTAGLALAMPGPGDTPPSGLGLANDGSDAKVENSAGKVTVVTFWASWCGPCMKELPMLEAIQRAAKGELQVVAVNIEERERYRRVSRAISPALTLRLTHDYDGEARKAYGVKGIPHMLIIGRGGKILAMHRGYDESSLDGIIAEINAALAAR